jgi:thymidylate synthase ThyX
MTTNLSGWKHFFELRCAPDAHPDIQVVANMAKELYDAEI